MAKILAQKTFKVELEVTVNMEELTGEHFASNEKKRSLPRLQRLQQALLDDDDVLTQQMLAQLYHGLQAYLDTLTSQDNLASLANLLPEMDDDDRDFFEDAMDGDTGPEFASLTRPLRASSINVLMKDSTIHEKSDQPGEPCWQPVWRDLLLTTQLGQMVARYTLPASFLVGNVRTGDQHYLLAQHLTQRKDGVHFEARCTCDLFLDGKGENEEEALTSLWRNFQVHYSAAEAVRRLLSHWDKPDDTDAPGDIY